MTATFIHGDIYKQKLQNLHIVTETSIHSDNNIEMYRQHLPTVAATVKHSSNSVCLVTVAFTHSDSNNFTHHNTSCTHSDRNTIIMTKRQ